MTRLFGVIGDPISHSLSPLIHRGWIRDLDLSADYLPFHVLTGEALAGLDTLARRGVRGVNVTMPHKHDVLSACETRSALVEQLGAANTLSRTSSGSWHADNTDHDGFLADFTSFVGSRLAGKTVLIIGAGGSARAVALALNSAGAELVIANRTLARAIELCAAVHLPPACAIGLDKLAAGFANADMTVNCLSMGLLGTGLDLPAGNRRPFYDLSYGKAARPTLESARAAGWQATDGLGMLVEQAALSFQIWHGVSPDRQAALKRCRTALEAVG